MSRVRLLLSSLLIAMGAGQMASCGSDKSTDPPDDRKPFFPEAFQEFYTMVRDCRPSTDHPAFVTVWADPSSFQDYLDGNYPFEPGAVIVKVLYTDPGCTQIRQFDVMKKGPPGTATDSGDWLWQEVRPDRSVLSEGVQRTCFSCHIACTSRDFTCTDE